MNLEPLVADLRTLDPRSFMDVWRTLGRHGVLRRFVDPRALMDGCGLLEALAHDHDELSVFLSIISGCGLAIPILSLHDGGVLPAPGLLERALEGESLLAVAITEPEAGSDALGMKSALTRSGGRLTLRGHKWNITNAPVADHLIVFCQDETTPQRFLRAAVVPSGAPGVEIRPQRLFGCEGSPTGEILLHDVNIDPSWVLPADGRQLLDLAFLRERVLAPWPLLGKMARVIQEAIDHVEARRQFGHPLKDFQYVQEKIVSSYERLETSRLLAVQAVEAVASGHPSLARASLAKHHATDSAAWVFRTILEVHGSHGLQAEARLGAYLADAICSTVAGGTREMHKKVIFDQLLLDRSRSRRRGRSSCFHVTAAARPRAESEE